MLRSRLHIFFAVRDYVESGSRRLGFASVRHDFTPDNMSVGGMSGDGLGPPPNVGKHGDQGIGWGLEVPGFDGGGAVSREDLQLLVGIGA